MIKNTSGPSWNLAGRHLQWDSAPFINLTCPPPPPPRTQNCICQCPSALHDDCSLFSWGCVVDWCSATFYIYIFWQTSKSLTNIWGKFHGECWYNFFLYVSKSICHLLIDNVILLSKHLTCINRLQLIENSRKKNLKEKTIL